MDLSTLDSTVTELDLNGEQVTDDDLKHLKGLTALDSLGLTCTDITDAGLAHLAGLTALTYLDLTGTAVTDAGLVHLKGLTDLEELYLYDTEITKEGKATLRAALPNCQINPLVRPSASLARNQPTAPPISPLDFQRPRRPPADRPHETDTRLRPPLIQNERSGPTPGRKK